MLLNSLTHGFVMGLSLIVAIGAQNTFVLKQGLKQQHIFWVCFVCALSDAILIMVGVMGFGTILLQHPIITDIAKFAGATFLAVYGAMHFWQAWKAEQHFLIDDNQLHSLWKTISICLAFTWLNPHVYLDTVVLLGSISVQFYEWKIYFALGAMTASFMFFLHWVMPLDVCSPFSIIHGHGEYWIYSLDLLCGGLHYLCYFKYSNNALKANKKPEINRAFQAENLTLQCF